ncbi:MAG: hypothetical protein U0528_16120 [Anaerolineae bacterium]
MTSSDHSEEQQTLPDMLFHNMDICWLHATEIGEVFLHLRPRSVDRRITSPLMMLCKDTSG